MASLVDRLSTWVGHSVRWLVLLMVLLGAFNAVARYSGRFVGVNLSSNALLEGQWYLFAAVFLLGAPYALVTDRHVRVDVLYGRLSERGKAGIDLVGTLLFLLPFCVFGLWVSWPSVANSWSIWEQSSDPGGLPRYPVKTLLPLALALLLLQGASLALQKVARLREAR